MSLSLKELMEIAASTEVVDFTKAKEALPIAFLLEKYGFAVEQDGQRLVSLCPFHDDHKPSMSIFGSEVERFNCFSCQARGDSIDLLQHFEPDLVAADGKFTKKLFTRIRELILEVTDSGWAGPSGKREVIPFDVQQASEIVTQSQLEISYSRIDEFIQYKREQRGEESWPFGAEWLAERWNVGVYGHWLIIPYYDQENNLLAYKRWSSPEDRRKAAANSTGLWADHLYGEWRDDGHKPVLMCEGESDTWWADYHLGDEYLVLGLPTGVDSATNAATRFAGRNVFLAFDADGDDERGGRMATKKWLNALEENGAYVKIVPIPDGRDLSTADTPVTVLIDQARAAVIEPPGIYETPRGYEAEFKGKRAAISNFVFVPKRGLHGPDMSAFEGVLMPGGDPAVIQTSDLHNESQMRKWASSHRRSWWGSSKDAGMLLAVLQAREVFLPSAKLVTVTGLHKTTFVWPNGKIGNDPVVYVPPATEPNISDKIKLSPGPWSTELIHLMREVHRSELVDPLLAWLMFAPMRSLCPEFPFVMVTGPKGSGKSETVRLIVSLFSGSSYIQTFTSTPHSIKSGFRMSNAFPQIDEEYRSGGRKDSLEAVGQLVREAYGMQASRSGGMGGSWQAIQESVPTTPTIISGENEFEEGSHFDRMIPLIFSSDGQNSKAFAALIDATRTANGLPYSKLNFLHEKFLSGKAPTSIDVEPETRYAIPVRQRHNLGILNTGWSWLQEFMAQNNDHLGEPNFSGVVNTLTDSNKRTPVEAAIKWCMYEPEAYFVTHNKSNGEVWIQVESFYAFMKHPARAVMFEFPGGITSIRHHLGMNLGARIEYKDDKEYSVFNYALLEPQQ